MKALWPAGGLLADLDVEALSDYFSYLYVPAPKTIYRQFRKLRPAHYCGHRYGNQFVPVFNKPMAAQWFYEGEDEEFRDGEDWRHAFQPR